MSSLQREFENRLHDSIRESIALGYHPHRFEELLKTYDGQTTAKRLIASGELQDGLHRLAKMKHPELTMESIMLEPQFDALFSEDERSAARWRLQEAMDEVTEIR